MRAHEFEIEYNIKLSNKFVIRFKILNFKSINPNRALKCYPQNKNKSVTFEYKINYKKVSM